MKMKNVSVVTEFILRGLPHSSEFKNALVLLFTLMYICTLLGNTILITVVTKTHSLHTPKYFFLTHLSFLDIFLSSVTLPKLLETLICAKPISFNGCVAQMYFFHFLGSSESFLYTAMAYDRYVVICQPLRYNYIMTWKFCMCLSFGSWLTGCLHSITHPVLTFQLPFCGSNEIDYFFCDISAVLKLACADTTVHRTVILGDIGAIAFACFILILISYVHIISAILKIKTVGAKKKTFSTCASHLTVVLLFYVPCAFTYFRPYEGSSLDSLTTVFYTMVTPLLNPLNYSLRNSEVKLAIWKLANGKQN